MKIKQLLAEKETVPVEMIRATATLRETADKLLNRRIGALVVTDDLGRMTGIVSERDLIQIVAGNGALGCDKPVSDVMTRDVITCHLDDEVAHVLRLMNANSIRHMPVLNKGKLVDMVSIRELTTAYELLQIEADTDPLTELSNRRPFLKMLEREFARAKRYKHPFSVAMIDIDHFKRVNDTFGHDAGDRVLRAMSAMLVSEFRTIDLVGRLGGEEFAVVFPETEFEGARTACERLRKTIEAAIIPVQGHHITVTISIGLAQACADVLDGSGVLKRADELLFQAKAAGRNRLLFESRPRCA